MVDSVSDPYREAHDRHDTSRVGGSTSIAPEARLEAPTTLRLSSDRDLSRVGFWSVLLGGLSAVVGITFLLAGGILPGALVAGLGLICALVGALTLALVAHHAG